jgi:hypothetical protein
MADMMVLGKQIGAPALVKVRAGKEDQALVIAKKNGADDVFVRVGKDTYVASGRDFDAKTVKAGHVVKVGDIEGVITSVDDQINSFKDGGQFGAPIGLGLGALAGVGTALWASASVPALVGPIGGFMAPFVAMGVLGMALGAGAGAFLAVAGGLALWASKRKIDLDAMKAVAG